MASNTCDVKGMLYLSCKETQAYNLYQLIPLNLTFLCFYSQLVFWHIPATLHLLIT